ncbi:MAG: AAA family ATPase [Anaerolineae bacterium]|nr:AAA family ATPase [Anaerolineae bacterium]
MDLTPLGLLEPPFSLSPDPRYFYLSAQHRTTLAKTTYVIEQRQGLAVVFGDVGMGKTSVARRLFDQYRDRADYRTAYIPSPHYKSAFHFLKGICAEFGLPPRPGQPAQLGTLQEYLLSALEAHQNVLLIVDEAQLLVGPQFELLRQLLNFELNDRKLLQIVMLGQNQLRNKLRAKRALESRVATRSTLDPLDFPDTRAMIEFRLLVAGRRDPLFSEGGLRAVFTYSKGVPREVCRLGLNLLPAALQAGVQMVGEDLVQRVAEELR